MTVIERNIEKYRKWCQRLNIFNSNDINDLIESGSTNWLINISEIWHEQKISELSRKIFDNIENKKIILISGPSSSGKTSFATRLSMHLRVLGIKSISISLDDYFIPNEDMPLNEEGKPDFEALNSIDYKLFNTHIENLIAGNAVRIPHYSFHKKMRIDDTNPITLGSDEVIIVEGIHGLNEKLSSSIADENKYKIYCTPLTVLTLHDGSKISSTDTRLMRRLIRDYYFRNSSYEYTFELWPNVEAGAIKNIFPYTDSADMIFNSSLLYEFCCYKSHIDKIVGNVGENDPNYETVLRLRNIVNSFKSIEEIKTPPTSLIREFIGGSTIV